ncbi:sigma factor-binding protein Crl [Psychromonas sp. PT13]|uniref:sigma factor-binding protein Crl n=1 Tax=Psychromonas sp. PT13 TaxID=3439547 RepID=UPI003EC022B1
MTEPVKKIPSRGRLFKLFTDLGPYFRKQFSTESLFFFDCLEICVDPEKEPEEREFYGWWINLKKDDSAFIYERFDGIYNTEGEWVVESLNKENKAQTDKSFKLFVDRLASLIDTETGLQLKAIEDKLVEV